MADKKPDEEKELFNKAPVAMAITEKYRKVYEPESPKISPIDYTKAFNLFTNNMEKEAHDVFFSLLSKGLIRPTVVTNWSEEVLQALAPFFDVGDAGDNVDGRIDALLQDYKKWLLTNFTDIDVKKVNSLTPGRVRISEFYNMMASKQPTNHLPNFYSFGIKNPTKQNLKALDLNAVTIIEKWLSAS